MKYILLFVFSFFGVIAAHGQIISPPEKVVITIEKNKTEVRTNENGVLHINVSPDDVLKFRTRGSVRYSEFGARGDGTTDDIDAIAAAHAFANQHDLLVKADEGAIYYIGGKERTTDLLKGTTMYLNCRMCGEKASFKLVARSFRDKPHEVTRLSSRKVSREQRILTSAS